MQSAKEYLESERNRMGSEAKAIADKAEAESRSLSAEEKGRVEDILRDTGLLTERIERMKSDEDLRTAIARASDFAEAEPTVGPETAKTIGEAFVKSEGYKGHMARGLSGEHWTSGMVEFGAKLTDGGSPALNVESITAAGSTLPLQPQVGPILGPVEDRLTIAALFSQGTATQNSIVYLEETSTTTLLGGQAYSGQSSAASTTGEGVAKIPVFIDFTKRTTSIEKVAAFLPISEEMLEDEPQISSYITARLSLFVRQAEEAYLMNKLLGSGIGTADASTDIAGTNMFDAIAAGILSCQVTGGLEPDAVLIHPQDFWKMSVVKDSVGGNYFSGGPYAPPLRSPWGIPTVVTREAMNGFPLVGAFREGATLWRKGGLSVEASNSHSDYFRKNLVALRAEERIGLTVLRPKAFVKVTI